MVKYLFENCSFRSDYHYLKNMFLISEYVSQHHLFFNGKKIKIFFNPFTSFGRFGLKENSNSFNILSLHKEKRVFLQPESNDFIFCEFDYNAFEIRTLLAVLKLSQPSGDLYDILHATSDFKSRIDFKKDLITKMYSGKENETILSRFLQERNFYKKYKIQNGFVENIFGKKMESDSFHLLSRVLQSSAAYIFSQQIINLINFITTMNLESKVSFCLHDSVCVSLHKSELKYIDIFKSILEDVYIRELNYNSIFPCKTKIGKNYGELQIKT